MKLTTQEKLELIKKMATKVSPHRNIDMGVQLGFSQKYFDAMYTIAVKYYDNNRYDDAIKILYNLIPLQPSAFRNYKAMGACLQGKKDYATAIQVYQKSLPLAFMDVETYFYIGQCQFLQKDYVEAAKTLKLAEHFYSKHPEQWQHIEKSIKELRQRALEHSQQ
jgi:tetratricopeptide (TPR) repeat protein